MLPSRITSSASFLRRLLCDSATITKTLVGRSRANLRPISTTARVLNNTEQNDHPEELEQNPYYEKYADKIKRAQAEAEKYERTKPKPEARLKQETEKWKRNIEMVEEKLTEKKKKQEDANHRGCKLPSKLDDLIRMELLESKTPDEIAHIWMKHFKEKECISAVIPADVFADMISRIEEYPTFLYPLPKSQGYEFVLSQFDSPSRCFFTSLINFQVHGDNAPWQLCMTFYNELKASKGIVLMTSELDTSGLNVMEAQCLAQLQKLFYADPTEQRQALLHCFNKSPDAFKYMNLVKEVEESNMVVKGLSSS